MDDSLYNEHVDSDMLAADFARYEQRTKDKEKMWGNISRVIILLYVFAGGGYEIISGLIHWHIAASFIFSFMSCLIFVCRIFYAHYSGATRTMWSDICGAAIMLVLSILHVVINGSFL